MLFLNNKRNIAFILKLSFYVYVIFFWIKMIFLAKALMGLETPGQAVHIMQTSNIFLVKIIRAIISNKKAWYYVIPSLIKEVSFPYLILVYLWVSQYDDKILNLLSFTILFPLIVLLGVLFSLNQKTLANGLSVAHSLGILMIVFSVVMSVYTLVSFLKERKNIELI